MVITRGSIKKMVKDIVIGRVMYFIMFLKKYCLYDSSFLFLVCSFRFSMSYPFMLLFLAILWFRYMNEIIVANAIVEKPTILDSSGFDCSIIAPIIIAGDPSMIIKICRDTKNIIISIIEAVTLLKYRFF